MKRKLLTILALLCLTVTSAWADGSCGDGLTWALSSEGKTLTISYTGSGTGAMEDYTDTDPAPWYSHRGDITSVVIKNGVTTIGTHAFEGCKLTSITLPEGLTTINASAFSDNETTIERVSIPQSVTFIGNNAFKGTSVQNFYINNIPSKIAIGETSPFEAPGVSIHVFTLMKSIFENAQNWSNYQGRFVEDIDIIHVKSITLDNTNMVVLPGSSGKLDATIKPGDARVKDVVYSTNSDVIHITNPATGDFEAGADEGIATITCAAMDGSGASTSCIVKVQESFTPAVSVTTNKSKITLAVGNSAQLTATIAPATATYKNIIWRSSDEDIAEVVNGVVTAKASGVATITATSGDGAAHANCEVTVSYGNLTLTDGLPYTIHAELPVRKLSYERVFNNTAWQPLYIPFRWSYEDWKDDFDVAELLNVYAYDNDGDGQEETIVEIVPVTEGTLQENHPYLIKAKTPGQKIFYIENTTIYPAESNAIQFASTENIYEFRGVYEKTDVPYEGGYVMNSGQFRKSNSTTTINPYRFYLQITTKDGQPVNDANIVVTTIVASGYCGDPSVNDGKDVTYSLTDNGVMTISGKGAMADYTDTDPAPWYSHKDGITSVVIGDGVTSIGDWAFAGCASLATATLDSNPYIGENAFTGIKDGATVTMNLKANLADGAYWTTFYNKNYSFQADANTQVFKVTLSGTKLTMHEIGDRIVDADKPVVLKTTDDHLVMTLTTSASGNEDGDDLKGVSAPEGQTTDGTMYVLNYTAANGMGFYKLASGKTLGVGKAYLYYDGSAAREFFSFGESTSVDHSTLTIDHSSEAIYDLQGRRMERSTFNVQRSTFNVQRSMLQKGLYIVRSAEGRLQGKNGKKVVIK